MKKSIIVTLFIFIATAHISYVSAADVTVACSDSSCSPSTSSNFFSASEKWYPNKTATKTLQITNSSSTAQVVSNQATNSSNTGSANLPDVIDLTIKRLSDNAVLWAGTLQSYYSNGQFTISSLASGATETYEYIASMHYSAGNSYQNTKTEFDLLVGFTSTGTTITPTPTPCTAQKPGTPGNLSLTQTNFNTVKASWSGVGDPKTGYYLSWGTTTNAEGAGSRFTSDTETTADGLDLGNKRYYFKVRAVNNCTNGDFSGVTSIGSGPDLLAPTSSPSSSSSSSGTSGGVLGASTLSTEGSVLGLEDEEATDESGLTGTPTVTPTPKGEVKAAATSCSQLWWWWLVVVGYLVGQTILILLRKRIVPNTRLAINGVITLVAAILLYYSLCNQLPWIIGIILISIISQLVFKSSRIYTAQTVTATKTVEDNSENTVGKSRLTRKKVENGDGESS
jgi:hypothetical protein